MFTWDEEKNQLNKVDNNTQIITARKQHPRNRRYIMPITKKRLDEIKAFKNTDFSDCPELTDEQLAQMKLYCLC